MAMAHLPSRLRTLRREWASGARAHAVLGELDLSARATGSHAGRPAPDKPQLAGEIPVALLTRLARRQSFASIPPVRVLSPRPLLFSSRIGSSRAIMRVA